MVNEKMVNTRGAFCANLNNQLSITINCACANNNLRSRTTIAVRQTTTINYPLPPTAELVGFFPYGDFVADRSRLCRDKNFQL